MILVRHSRSNRLRSSTWRDRSSRSVQSRSLSPLKPATPTDWPIRMSTSRTAASAAAQIRHLAASDPASAADAIWATADTLHVAAAALGSQVLRWAADAYDRAGRAPYGRIPCPSQTGNSLRRAARMVHIRR
jgi:hypothetical protein